MIVNCHCGVGFDLPYANRKQLLQDFPKFCGTDCLLSYVNKRRSFFSRRQLKKNNISQALEYWDHRFQMFFRSKSESIAAHFFTDNFLEWEYEPYTISLNATKEYTPDFLLPDFGHFIEVKGLWKGSGKKKIRMATSLGYSLILIPDYLIRIMEKWNAQNNRMLPSEENPFP